MTADPAAAAVAHELWSAEIEAISGGLRYRICREEPMPFSELFRLLETDSDFCSWYARLLASAPMDAYFWEHPPLDRASIERTNEFVLLESAALARLRPDPAPFRRAFARAGERPIAVFRNLGGDALLVAPRPLAEAGAYAHLAAFVRRGPAEQLRDLWAETARLVRERLSVKPLWLSTSGLGVAWLHLRLDRVPKYYQHLEYRSAA